MVKRGLKYLYIAAVYLVLYVPLLVTIVFRLTIRLLPMRGTVLR